MRLQESEINQFRTKLAIKWFIMYIVNEEKLLCVQILESTVKSQGSQWSTVTGDRAPLPSDIKDSC